MICPSLLPTIDPAALRLSQARNHVILAATLYEPATATSD
jgi:hypothetical protein